MSEFDGLWKHPSCTVSWEARLCRSWLSTRKTTRFSHKRNANKERKKERKGSTVTLYILCESPSYCLLSRSGELRTQKSKSHLLRTQLEGSPRKPGVGQYIATHATLTARDFFLVNVYLSGPFTCIFSKTSPEFFLC